MDAAAPEVENRARASAQAFEGLAELQAIREGADLSGYGRAGEAFERALAIDPGQFEATLGKGLLLLALHDFSGGLDWGQRALALRPSSAPAHGILVDAYAEMGRYEEASAAAQRMVELRPDQAAYSRISYLRELHGQVDAAAEAMRMAAESGPPDAEGTLWSWHRLGKLHWEQGRLEDAEAAYQHALQVDAGYTPAAVGMAEIAWSRGDRRSALDQMEALAEQSGSPDDLVLLGELLEQAGRVDEAQERFAQAREAMRPDEAAGSDLDLPIAMFRIEYEPDFDASTLVETARAAYERAPSVIAAGQLAWVLHHAGQHEEAWRYSQRARRLGTRQATMYYRAGLIAKASGRDGAAADLLERALDINPDFSVRHAPRARALLEDWGTVAGR